MKTHGQARWFVLAGLWLLYFSFGLVVTSLSPLVLLIEEDLNITHSAMGAVMGVWQLVYIGAAIPCGILLDRLGAKYSLVIGALLIAASAAARGVVDEYAAFLLAVGLFGVGGPIISSGAPKVVAQLFEGSDRGLAMGIYMTGPALGGIVSLTMTHAVLLPVLESWRGVMFLWGGVSAAVGVIWLIVASAAGLTHEVEQRRVSQRSEIKALLSEDTVRIVLIMSVGVFLFNHGLNNWLPELLRSYGMTQVAAGYWAALPTLVGILGSLTIPRLATPERRFPILIALCVAAAVASALLQFADGPVLAVALVLQGIARSAMMTVLVLALVELPGIGQERAGVAGGLFFTAAEVGGVLGPLGIGVAYDLQGHFSGGLLAMTATAILLTMGASRLGAMARVRGTG